MKRWCTWGALGALLVLGREASAQPTIEHDRARCLPPNQFIELLAEIRPPEEVRTAKVYFRSSLYPDYYYVEMSGQGSSFQAMLPMPTADTTSIVYYLETVDLAFNTTRSREIEVDVARDSRCSPGPGVLLFSGSDPGIVIGATRLGLAALPPGFQAAGVAGFISAAGGAAAGAGGGLGIGVAVGAAAGAAAGVGVVVAKSGDETSSSTVTTTSPLSGTTTGPGTSSSTAITTSAPGSTTSISSTTSPTSSSTTSVAAPALNACIEWTALGNCRVHFDSCSTPASAIVSYKWRMLGPPPNLDIGSTESFDFDFSPYDPRCTGTMTFNRPIRLTVSDGAGNMDEVQQNVDIIPGALVFHGGTKIRMTAQMTVPGDPTARGYVVVNGGGPQILSGTNPLEIATDGRVSDYEILAYAEEPEPSGAFFQFEVVTENGHPPSSIQVLQGSVVARGPRRIVVRSASASAEMVTLRVRFGVSP